MPMDRDASCGRPGRYLTDEALFVSLAVVSTKRGLVRAAISRASFTWSDMPGFRMSTRKSQCPGQALA